MPLVAHPFGPPMEATLSREDGRLVLTWTAAEDDWVVVGEASGAFAEREDGETGAQVLADSPAVQEFLAPHLVLSQGGQECTREWLPTRDLLDEGVRMGFTCPDEQGPVTVGVDVLTDVNEAYRTVLRVEGGEEVLFTATTTEHEVQAGAVGEGGGGPGTQLVLLLVVAVVVVLGAVALGVAMLRGERSRRTPAPTGARS